MLQLLRNLLKNLPTFGLAIILAVTVWISAVTQTDPTVSRIYPNTVKVDLVGQDPGMVIMNETPSQISLMLSAPQSIWNQLLNEQIPVRAVVDLSGLEPGEHVLPIQVQIGIRPVVVKSYSPQQIKLNLEHLVSRSFPVTVSLKGDIGVGFQMGTPQLIPQQVTVSGPDSIVNRIAELRTQLDVAGIKENTQRSLMVQAVDASGAVLSGITISPDQVNASLSIEQLGGYRNVVVKVILKGQVVNGYRVTNISVFPPAVTVFSSDPKLVESLPGYVETAALGLDGVKDDVDMRLPLNLPPGVSVVGDQTVGVQVGVASIEGSLTLTGMKVDVIGLADNLSAKIAPETVDVILTGPVSLLSNLNTKDVRVVVDLKDDKIGTYQRVPKLELTIPDIKVQSILPGSVEITVSSKTAATKTPVK
jgi:YbbR domain-containing protein